MDTAIVNIKNISLSYPVYSIKAQSIRNTVANLAIGGRLLKDGQDIVHVKAINELDFTLQEGDRLGLVGHNGAGKTTLLKVLAGVYEPDSGEVSIDGEISSMIDISQGMDHDLTGRENIINMGRVRGFSTKQILVMMPDIIEFTELGSYIDMPVKTYSAGMITRLVFGVATANKPDILLMDEWIGAGDKFFFEKAQNRLNEILHQARVIVLASHNWNLINDFCNKILVMENGSKIYFGPVTGWDEVNNRPF
jgi:ABC-type polysaccharide/polyol phosphate transport system ATPase subunit